MHNSGSVNLSQSGMLNPLDALGDLGIALIENMKRPKANASLSSMHKKGYYPIDEVLYGYYSLGWSSKELFSYIFEAFKKAMENKNERTTELIFTVRWLKCMIYYEDYSAVKETIKDLYKLAETSDNLKVCKVARKIEDLCKMRSKEESHLHRESFNLTPRSFMSPMPDSTLSTKKLCYCENLEDLLVFHDGNIDKIASEFRAFFASVECQISPIDILKKQPIELPEPTIGENEIIEINDVISPEALEDKNSIKPKLTTRKNSFSEAASLNDKIVWLIMENILSQTSRTNAERRYALFLNVAMVSLHQNDSATAFAIRIALENNLIARLKLLDLRPRNTSFKEKMGFDGKKKEKKKIFDSAIIQYSEIQEKCSLDFGFASIRKIETASSGSPHVSVILRADVEKISQILTFIERDGKALYYNPERLSAFSNLLETFAKRQQEVRNAEHKSDMNLLKCVMNSKITENVLRKRSNEIKITKFAAENWSGTF